MARWRLGLGIGAAVTAPLLARLVLAHGGPAALAVAAAGGASHAATYGGLLLVFARSLRRGRVDLVTGLAARLQPGFTPAMAAYTRRVTQAWCVFFAAQLLGSALLLAFAPRTAWSCFVGLNLPLAALMFAAELAVRRRRFPGHPRVPFLATLRAFRAGGPSATPPRPAAGGASR